MEENTLKQLGRQIQLFRKRRGYTQAKLAKLAGRRQASVSQIETGSTDVRLSTLAAILRVLDARLEIVPIAATEASTYRKSIETIETQILPEDLDFIIPDPEDAQ